MFLLDTDHIGIIQRKTQPEFSTLWDRIQQHPPAEFFTSVISFHEQVLGWNAYLNRARETSAVVRAYGMFEQILRDFAHAQVLSFDSDAANVFDDLRRQRIRAATMDLRIAAIAISRDLTLLTRNIVDFRHIPGVRFEDWTT